MRGAELARVIFAAALFAPLLAFGQTRPLELKDCVDIALGRSPDLRAADFDIRAATEVMASVRAGLLPSLSGQATALTLFGQPTNAFALLNVNDPQESPLTSHTQTAKGLVGFGSVSLNYGLFKDGSIFGLNDAPAIGVAKAQRTVLTWTKDLQREQIIFIVANSFLDAATRAARMRLDARRVELSQQRLANIQTQVQLGLKLPTDLEVAKSQLTSSQQVLRLSQAQSASSRLNLAAFIGRSAETLVVSTRLPPAPRLPATDKLLANALAKHPGVGVQNAVVDQQFNAYRLARAQLYPQVALSSSYLYGADLTAPGDRHVYTGSVVVSVPIFDFGMLRANKRAAQDKYQAEKIRLEKVADNIRGAILTAYGALVIIQETAASAERDQVLAATAFHVARSQSQAGLVPPIAAVDAELLLIDKQEALNDQREAELQQFAALQNAAGGSWAWLR